MAKVTVGAEELRGSLKVMLRGPLLTAMEQWGIQRPDKMEFTYDVKMQAILLHARWGKWVVSHHVDEGHVNPVFIDSFVELLAQDANIPIAEEL